MAFGVSAGGAGCRGRDLARRADPARGGLEGVSVICATTQRRQAGSVNVETFRTAKAKECGMLAGSRLILASASPRRLALLGQIGLTPDEVRAADIDEARLPGESARRAALRLAEAKAAAVWRGEDFVLAADTIVSLGGRMLGKPTEEAEAREMLGRLSGRGHRVLTGVAVIAPDGRRARRLAEARVRFKPLDAGDVDRLIASGEWRGAAGAYRIQGQAGACVTALTGSYTAIVGLPLYETLALLNGLGFRRR
jgi:septum formation protein